jgi:hypothetical protein
MLHRLLTGQETMRLWEKLRFLLGFSYPTHAETGESDGAGPTSQKREARAAKPTTSKQPGEPVRLDATSETLKALEPGQKGWISFDDSARLFSPKGEHPSEWDSEGRKAIGEFAAQIEHRSTPERNAAQQRIYFTRIRTLNL